MGFLIAIDGLDGSGKQTQAELLYENLLKRGVRARLVSFPDYDSSSSALVKLYLDGAFSKNPDDVNPYAASSFYAVDRFSSYTLGWKRDYEDGAVIVANRYTTANAIHQLSKIKGAGERERFLSWLYDFEFGKLALPAPDVTFLLTVPVEISLSLIQSRSDRTGRKTDIHETPSHLAAAYDAAFFAAARLGWEIVACAERDRMRSREEIGGEILAKAIEKIEKAR